MLDQQYQRVKDLETEVSELLKKVTSVPTSELLNHPEWADQLEAMHQELNSSHQFAVLVESITKGRIRDCWQQAHVLLCEHGYRDVFHATGEPDEADLVDAPPQGQPLPTPPAGIASEQLVPYLAELREWIKAELLDLFDAIPEDLQERLLPVGNRYHCPDFKQAMVVFGLLKSIQGFSSRWDRLRTAAAANWTTDYVLTMRFATVEDILTSYEELISPSADDKVARSGLVFLA